MPDDPTPKDGETPEQAIERLNARISELNEESKKHRLKAKGFEDDLTVANTKLGTLESEKSTLSQESQTAKNEAAALRKERAIERMIARSGALYSDLVLQKVDASKVTEKDGKFDDEAIKQQIADVRKQYPALFGSTALSGDAGANGGGANADMNSLIRRASGRRG